MRFIQTVPDQNFAIARWISEEGKWELGFRQMLFGIDVGLGTVGDDGCVLNYCAGNDQGFALILLATVAQILEHYPEDVRPYQLERDFPKYQFKPIYRDACWGKLQQMAGIEQSPSITCPECDRVSYNPNDILNRYCRSCHQYHDIMAMQKELEQVQGDDRHDSTDSTPTG